MNFQYNTIEHLHVLAMTMNSRNRVILSFGMTRELLGIVDANLESPVIFGNGVAPVKYLTTDQNDFIYALNILCQVQVYGPDLRFVMQFGVEIYNKLNCRITGFIIIRGWLRYHCISL
jgi:hypothetical protein